MAEKRDVDWVAIRREWESSNASDLELATRHGYKSENSVLRRRQREGWKRDAELATAIVVAHAVEGTGSALREAGVGDLTPHLTPAPTPLSRENLGYPPEDRLGVGAKTPELAASEVVPLASRVRMPSPEERAQAELLADGLRASLVAVRVQATHDQLRRVDYLLQLFDHYSRLLMVVATSDDPVEISDAINRLRGVNSERETLAALLKTTTGMLAEAFKMQRAALGMDQVVKAGDEAERPVGDNSRQALLRNMSPEGMLAIREALEKTEREERTVEGQAEPPA